MKVIGLKLLMPFIFLAASLRGFAQDVSKQNLLRVLLIGNSFSQNASTYLTEISKERGHELVIGHAEIGDCSLQKHWD